MGLKPRAISGYPGLLGSGLHGRRRGMGGTCCHAEDEGKADTSEWSRAAALVDRGGRTSELSCG